MYGKISNITNSSEPQAINSRIFVGNVNTFALTKEDVESVFKRYGKIIGISMHKGYAFIQYTNEAEARNAVAGEDQRMYAGQQIDVNPAAEPKPNRPNRKRPQDAGAEWDYYYNVPLYPGTIPLQVPLAKRPRPDLVAPPTLSPLLPQTAILPQMNKRTLMQVGGHSFTAGDFSNGFSTNGISSSGFSGNGFSGSTYGGNSYTKVMSPLARKTPLSVPPRGRTDEGDILICGTCKQIFQDLEKLTAHKRSRCRLRFACKCNTEHITKPQKTDADEPTLLTCATCHVTFTSCWLLCQHCQQEHKLAIYTSLSPNPHHQDDKSAESGLNSPGSGSLSSDVSSVDINMISEYGPQDCAAQANKDCTQTTVMALSTTTTGTTAGTTLPSTMVTLAADR